MNFGTFDRIVGSDKHAFTIKIALLASKNLAVRSLHSGIFDSKSYMQYLQRLPLLASIVYPVSRAWVYTALQTIEI